MFQMLALLNEILTKNAHFKVASTAEIEFRSAALRANLNKARLY